MELIVWEVKEVITFYLVTRGKHMKFVEDGGHIFPDKYCIGQKF